MNWKRKKIMEKKCEQVEEPIVEKEDIKHSSEQVGSRLKRFFVFKKNGLD